MRSWAPKLVEAYQADLPYRLLEEEAATAHLAAHLLLCLLGFDQKAQRQSAMPARSGLQRLQAAEEEAVALDLRRLLLPPLPLSQQEGEAEAAEIRHLLPTQQAEAEETAAAVLQPLPHLQALLPQAALVVQPGLPRVEVLARLAALFCSATLAIEAMSAKFSEIVPRGFASSPGSSLR